MFRCWQDRVAYDETRNPAALTAEAIMSRLAANQDLSEALRKQYVYKQQIYILTQVHPFLLPARETNTGGRRDAPGRQCLAVAG